MYFDDRQWVTRYFVVRIGGPMTGASVLIPSGVVRSFDPGAQHLMVDLTRREVGNSLAAGCVLPVSKHFDAEFRWRAELLRAPIIPPRPAAQDAKSLPEPRDPQLRSSDAIRGYRIRAVDGDAGKVEDLVLSESDWRIRFLLIGTRRWWPGKKVLVRPQWIQALDWAAETIAVRLPRDIVRNSLAYRPE